MPRGYGTTNSLSHQLADVNGGITRYFLLCRNTHQTSRTPRTFDARRVLHSSGGPGPPFIGVTPEGSRGKVLTRISILRSWIRAKNKMSREHWKPFLAQIAARLKNEYAN